MSQSNTGVLPVLYAEHLALAATFDEVQRVESYAKESYSNDAGTYLFDMSHLQMLLFSGVDAPAFSHAGFAGADLAIGECRFEAVLTGDGSIASIPLLARTGAHEYVVFDTSARADVLGAWLSFLSSINQDGFAPYARMETEDASGSHVSLLLWGADAERILCDYATRDRLPKAGHIVSCNLDKIPCIIARPSLGTPCYLVLVPPRAASVLWRSLLSFTEIEPVGMRAAASMLNQQLPWYARLDETNTLRMTAGELQNAGLARPSMDFVGARGIMDASKEEGTQ